jgi:hypothetical protein
VSRWLHECRSVRLWLLLPRKPALERHVTFRHWKQAVGVHLFSYRWTNSMVVSHRRLVRNPRTYLREAGVVYLFAYARSIAS